MQIEEIKEGLTLMRNFDERQRQYYYHLPLYQRYLQSPMTVIRIFNEQTHGVMVPKRSSPIGIRKGDWVSQILYNF